MEDKKRYGRIQHAPYSLNLAPYDFAFYRLHGKRFSDLDKLHTELDLNK